MCNNQIVRLDVAFEIISAVHTTICRDTSREDGIADFSAEILHRILHLQNLIKEKISKDNQEV